MRLEKWFAQKILTLGTWYDMKFIVTIKNKKLKRGQIVESVL